MFFDPKKSGTNGEEGAQFHPSIWAPKIPKGPIPIQKVDPKEAHPEFWRGPQGQSQPATLYRPLQVVCLFDQTSLKVQLWDVVYARLLWHPARRQRVGLVLR